MITSRRPSGIANNNARAYHPFVASIAVTGDMPDAWLRAGNVGTA
jgi:hypothetical protein